MKNVFLLLFITVLYSLKTAAQQTGVYSIKVKYTANNTIGNSTQFGSLCSNINTSLLLTKSHKWSQPNISGTSSISNRSFWKAQGKGGSQAGKGALIGMGIGTVIGGLIGLVVYKEPAPSTSRFNFDFDIGRGGSAAIGALGGLTSGAIIGAFIGANAE